MAIADMPKDMLEGIIDRFKVLSDTKKDVIISHDEVQSFSNKLTLLENAFNKVATAQKNITKINSSVALQDVRHLKEATVEGRGSASEDVSVVESLVERIIGDIDNINGSAGSSTSTGGMSSWIAPIAAGATAVIGAGIAGYQAYQNFFNNDNNTSKDDKARDASVSNNKAMENAASDRRYSEQVTDYIKNIVNNVPFINQWSTGSETAGGSPATPLIRDFNLEQETSKPYEMDTTGITVPRAYDIVERIGVTKKQWDIYRNTIARIESTGKGGYSAHGGANKHYDGRYQMGEAAKADAGQLLGISLPHDPQSRAEFRNNPELQELAFAAYTVRNHGYLKAKSEGERFKNMSVADQLAVLGYAHNQGAGKANNWLATGIVTADKFHTKGTKYSTAVAANLNTGATERLVFARSVEPSIDPVAKQTPMTGLTQTNVNMGGVSGAFNIASFAMSSLRNSNNLSQYVRLHRPSVNLMGLHPVVLTRFSNMAKEYYELTGRKIQVNSGFRTREEQARLYRENPRKAAPPGRSRHQTGLAIDIQTVDANRLIQIGLMDKYGFHRPVRGETWHIEPVEARSLQTPQHGEEGTRNENQAKRIANDNTSTGDNIAAVSVNNNNQRVTRAANTPVRSVSLAASSPAAAFDLRAPAPVNTGANILTTGEDYSERLGG